MGPLISDCEHWCCSTRCVSRLASDATLGGFIMRLTCCWTVRCAVDRNSSLLTTGKVLAALMKPCSLFGTHCS